MTASYELSTPSAMADSSRDYDQNHPPPSRSYNQGHEPSSHFANVFAAPAKRWFDEMRWTRDSPHVSMRRRWETVLSYAPDWIITIVLAAFLSIFVNRIYGFRREFSLTDTSLQHTYAETERVSTTLLAIVALVIPVAIIALISLAICRSVWDFHAGFLGIVLAHALTLTATTVIKVTVGRPRPDIIDRCQPQSGAMNGVPYGLVTQAICTTALDSSLLRDGFRSFPSGHSSTAFTGLTFLSIWLAGKVHLFHPGRGHAALNWLIFVPMIGAVLIAVSRTMDYRHHATDVIAGAILGVVIAVTSYCIYYPPLTHSDSHKPWPPRNSQPTMHPDYDVETTPLSGRRDGVSPA